MFEGPRETHPLHQVAEMAALCGAAAAEGLTQISRGRLETAKRSFTTRRVDLGRARRLATQGIPRAGDLVLAKVVSIGFHQRLESPEGRRARLYVDDEIVVAYGARYAPDQYEAIVPDHLKECDLVAGGGVAAQVLCRHASMRRATRIEPLGLLADTEGRVLNLADFALDPLMPGADRPTVIAIAGTSMNAGKTTAAAALIHGLERAGLSVVATKVTGTGSGGDLWSMRDAGASEVLDFTDMGHTSTAGLSPQSIAETALSLIAHCALRNPDVIIAEIADGLLQGETGALLDGSSLDGVVDGIVFAAGDAMSAIYGHRWLVERGYRVAAMTGLVSASPLAAREFEQVAGVAVLTQDALSDPEIAPKLCFASSPLPAAACRRG